MGKFIRPRLLQIIFTVFVIILVMFLCPLSELQRILVSLFCIFILHHIANLFIYIIIEKRGISSTGTIISCKQRSIIIKKEGLDFILHGFFKPIVVFYHGEKKCEDELWGAFYKLAVNDGDTLKIIIDQKSGRVISTDASLKSTYVVHTVIWCTILLLLIFITLIVK